MAVKKNVFHKSFTTEVPNERWPCARAVNCQTDNTNLLDPSSAPRQQDQGGTESPQDPSPLSQQASTLRLEISHGSCCFLGTLRHWGSPSAYLFHCSEEACCGSEESHPSHPASHLCLHWPAVSESVLTGSKARQPDMGF